MNRGTARRVDQAAHRPGYLLAAVGLVAVTVGGQRGGGRRGPVPVRGLPDDPAKVTSPGPTWARRWSPSLAVLAISTEYSTGMIRVTWPRCRAGDVLAAKAAVLTGAVILAAALAVAGRMLDRVADAARARLHRGARVRAAVTGRRHGLRAARALCCT